MSAQTVIATYGWSQKGNFTSDVSEIKKGKGYDLWTVRGKDGSLYHCYGHDAACVLMKDVLCPNGKNKYHFKGAVVQKVTNGQFTAQKAR